MKPILFNTEMVKALIEGRKTMTRRIANINTEITCNDGTTNHDFVLDNFNHFVRPTGFVCRKCGFGVAPPHSRDPVGTSLFRPRYWPDDILYVRETWCEGKVAYGEEPDGRCVPFISQCPGEDDIIPKEWAIREGIGIEDVVWKPSIFMPKTAARIFLRVKRVIVERLQDIDGEQAYREGSTAEVPGILEELETHGKPKFPKNFYKFSDEKKEDWCRGQATATYIALCELAQRLIRSFKNIWDSTIKPAELDIYGWDANPWVYVYEFERIKKEDIDHG